MLPQTVKEMISEHEMLFIDYGFYLIMQKRLCF